MSKIKVSASDFAEGKFSSLAKFIAKNCPTGKLKLSASQELLSRVLGYDNYHEAQRSASTTIVDLDNLQEAEWSAFIIERLTVETGLPHDVAKSFVMTWPLSYLSSFSGKEQSKLLLPNVVLDAITREFIECWHHELNSTGFTGKPSRVSFRDLALVALDSMDKGEQRTALKLPLIELFKVTGNNLADMSESFRKLHELKSLEAIEGVFRVKSEETKKLVRSTGQSRESIKQACKTGDLLALILESNFNGSMSERLLKPAVNVFYSPAKDRLIMLSDMDWPKSPNHAELQAGIRAKIEQHQRELCAYTLEAFMKDAAEDEELKGASSEEIEAQYKSYYAHLKADADYSIAELKIELKESLKIDQLYATHKFNNIELKFELTQVKTEDCEELNAYEWKCEGIDSHGDVVLVACGSVYNASDDPFVCGSDLIFTADFQTDLDVHFARQLLQSLCKEANQGSVPSRQDINTYDLSEIFMYGPLVFLQHFQRAKSENLKGIGLEALKFSLTQMSRFFGASGAFLAAELRPAQFYYNRSEPEFIKKMKSKSKQKLTNVMHDFCNADDSPVFDYCLMEPKEVIEGQNLLFDLGAHLFAGRGH